MSCSGMYASTVPVCMAYPVDCAICVCVCCVVRDWIVYWMTC